MTHFHLQEINGRIAHDFSFHLQEAILYQNWYRGKELYTWTSGEVPVEEQVVPVGSLPFVMGKMEKQFGIHKKYIVPINIPDALNTPTFTKRAVSIAPYDALSWDKEYFIKSATTYKSYADFINEKTDKKDIPFDTYFISERIDIDSEWRAFVYQGQLLDIRSYSGDFSIFPDIPLVKEMIKKYHNAPLSYTLDVGVNEKGTFVIEVHPFVSCGLYGFNDYRYLPQMIAEGYRFFCEAARMQQIKNGNK